MIQVAICDENNKTLEKLEKLIKNTLGNEVSVSTHDNVFSLVTYVCDERKGKLDAVYIDINAGQKGGIAAAESLQKEYPNIKIIFLSADRDKSLYSMSVFIIVINVSAGFVVKFVTFF